MYTKWKKTQVIAKDSVKVVPAPPTSTCTPCANLKSATYYS
jgi:hypothetical protein